MTIGSGNPSSISSDVETMGRLVQGEELLNSEDWDPRETHTALESLNFYRVVESNSLDEFDFFGSSAAKQSARQALQGNIWLEDSCEIYSIQSDDS